MGAVFFSFCCTPESGTRKFELSFPLDVLGSHVNLHPSIKGTPSFVPCCPKWGNREHVHECSAFWAHDQVSAARESTWFKAPKLHPCCPTFDQLSLWQERNPSVSPNSAENPWGFLSFLLHYKPRERWDLIPKTVSVFLLQDRETREQQTRVTLSFFCSKPRAYFLHNTRELPSFSLLQAKPREVHFYALFYCTKTEFYLEKN